MVPACLVAAEPVGRVGAAMPVERSVLAWLGCCDVGGLGGCCQSCHVDADEWEYPMMELSVPPNRRGQQSRVEVVVCCRSVVELTRSVVAAAVVRQRRAWRAL